MLVLSRHINERIVINGNIVITLVDICSRDKVKIGIDAPKDIIVHREEIQKAIDAEQRRDAREDGRAGR